MRIKTVEIAERAKGFLSTAEGTRLYRLARDASVHGPCVEIGSYCGKSALFLGEGCRESGAHPLFTVDHHRGNEEQQPGGLFFDPDLYDSERDEMTTLRRLLANIEAADLTDWVIPIVGESTIVGRSLGLRDLSLLFIDGGHTEAAAFGDHDTWSPLIRRGGYLCIHDIFENPADGGQAPFHVLQHARATGMWDDLGMTETLATLRRR